MKRLVMLCVLAMSVVTFAQGRDLKGSWVLDAEKSGANARGPAGVTITQTATDITISMGGGSNSVTFKLDGTESDLGRMGKGKTAWKGDKLEATVSSGRGAQTITFYREGAWLVQEGQGPDGPMKLYYKKAPAKS